MVVGGMGALFGEALVCTSLVVAAGTAFVTLMRMGFATPSTFACPLCPFLPAMGVVVNGYLLAQCHWEAWLRLGLTALAVIAGYLVRAHQVVGAGVSDEGGWGILRVSDLAGGACEAKSWERLRGPLGGCCDAGDASLERFGVCAHSPYRRGARRLRPGGRHPLRRCHVAGYTRRQQAGLGSQRSRLVRKRQVLGMLVRELLAADKHAGGWRWSMQGDLQWSRCARGQRV